LEAEAVTILDKIDNVVANLCPCGAEPAEGSAYCSDDCRPTHIADDTDIRMSGELATAMRWRPDLVTAADDTGLTLHEPPWRYGRFNAQVFERDGVVAHVRLDDGHRFVGCDVGPEVTNLGPVFERLERELTRADHTVPGERMTLSEMFAALNLLFDNAQPPVLGEAFRRREPLGVATEYAAETDVVRIRLFTDTTHAEPRHSPRDFPAGGLIPAGTTWTPEDLGVALADISRENLRRAFEGMRLAIEPVFRAASDLGERVGEVEAEADPMLAEIERRRTGADAGPRDRRGLDGRRRRTR
jgi:hypothetical protein